MPQPPAYTPEFDFAPLAPANIPQAGTRLNVELDNIAETLAVVRSNLALIQRDDGAPANRIVSFDTLNTQLRSLMGGWIPRGNWTTATAYKVKDLVTKDDVNYICAVAHTAGTFATDLAAGKWQFQYGEDFTVGDAMLVTPAGAPTASTMADHLAREFWVEDFGAVGDGVVDDTAAIQAAIVAAESAGGGVVRFGTATYKFTSMVLSSRGVTLQGAGRNTFGTANGTRLRYAGSTTGNWIEMNCDACAIQDFEIDATVTVTGGVAINIARNAISGSRNRVDRVNISDCYNAINVYALPATLLRDILVSNLLGAYGVRFSGDVSNRTDNLYMQRVTVGATTPLVGSAGFLMEGRCYSVFADDCYFRATTYGVHMREAGGVTPYAAHFRRCPTEITVSHGYYFESTGFVALETTSIGTAGDDGVYIGANCIGTFVLVNVRSGVNDKHGVNIQASAARVIILGGVFANNSQGSANVYHGIIAQAGASGFIISGSMCGGDNFANPAVANAQRNGITIGVGCTDYVVAGNDLRGNTNRALFDGGSGAVGTVYGNRGYRTTAHGVTTGLTPDGSGDVVITHTCDAVPVYATAGLLSAAGTVRATIQAITTTTLTVRLFNTTTGAAVTAGTFAMLWEVKSARAL